MSENSHHPDCPELSIEADECGLCPYLCAAQKRAWGDLEARARLATDIAYRMGVSHGEASRMVTAASNAYAEGRKVALDEATASVSAAAYLGLMTTEEAVAALNGMSVADPEAAHSDADQILLALVAPEVQAAYAELISRAPWWACA